MIYFVGDTHGVSESREKLMYNDSLKHAKYEDFVIVCGDFGLPFLTKDLVEWQMRQEYVRGDTRYTRCIKDINRKEYTLLFVDGNHDNHAFWNSCETEMWHGGKVHRHPNIDRCYHLMRGEIYNIDGYKVFTFGGALSIDKEYRTPNIDWWEQEEASVAETKYALDNLKNNSYNVDIIVTHTIPQSLISKLDNVKSIAPDATAKFLDFVYGAVKYKHWFAGHFHQDVDLVDEKISILYDKTKSIDKKQ